MKQLLRRAVRNAAAVSVVSSALAVKIATEYRPRGSVRVVNNAVLPELFRPGDRAAARRGLGLPPSKLLIGTAGSLSRRRGIATLYGAFERLRRRYDNLTLVLAGPSHRRMTGANIIYLGNMPHRKVPDLYSALDVGVVLNRDDAFGRYCFPQKLYEMLACELPVVAADVGAARELLHKNLRCLFKPENDESLADAIVYQLNARYRPEIPIPTWKDHGAAFEALLRTALGKRGAAFEGLASPAMPRP
jgi:glycosyltransferase involved in cell wall biosynthesis